MPQNLVEGGARRGWFQTRNSRQVFLHTEFDFLQAPLPGKEPESRKCWKGTIYQGDAKTKDTEGVWEQSGAYQNVNGVIQQKDLVQVVDRAEPADAPPAQPGEMLTLEAGHAYADSEGVLSDIGELFGEADWSKLPGLVRDLMASYDDLKAAHKALKKRKNIEPETAELETANAGA